MNQNFIIQSYEMQNRLNIEESVNFLEKIYKNFHTLGTIADQLPCTQSIIRENREILSYAHLEKLNEKIPYNNQFEYQKRDVRSGNKKKQSKSKWSIEEHKLFLEGLELYGCKSKSRYQ
jgi:hypothetical protein